MRNPNSKCEICGKEKYRRPHELKKASHLCCKECRSYLYKKYPAITRMNLSKGWGWNRGKSKARGDVLVYGRPRSAEARKRISIALKGKTRGGRISKHCKECGKEFRIFLCVEKRGGQFCSVLCSNRYKNKRHIYPRGENHSNWKGGKVIKICEICGKQYQCLRSKIKTRKYCSRLCKNKAQAIYIVRRKQQIMDTDIEVILESWLKEKHIKYDKQRPVDNITIPDFFIEPNICLYADGNYWHSLPRTKQRDRWINHQLEKNGYRVIRICGSEIKKGIRPEL